MCLAIPSKVTTIDGDMATIEVGGVTRAVSLMLLSDDVVLGDYVIVHAGFAIHKVDPEEAKESLKLFRQLMAGE